MSGLVARSKKLKLTKLKRNLGEVDGEKYNGISYDRMIGVILEQGTNRCGCQ